MVQLKKIVLQLLVVFILLVPAYLPAGEAAAATPKRGGKVTMAIWQSPGTLNFLMGTQVVTSEVLAFVVEGMYAVAPDGSLTPALAKELPSVQNGGVSADGKHITYHLKEGVLWSDGKPFTCEDVLFTYQTNMTPNVGIVMMAGYTDIERVECSDAMTFEVYYKNFFAPYNTMFNRIIPKHAAGDPKDIKNWAYNRKPLGTGPFKIDEWVADDHITLSRNENYREKGKPYLDQVIIRIVPSSEVGLQLLASGEVDILQNNSEADLPQLEKMAGVKISAPLGSGGERLFLNLAENKDGADPAKPHPILGDERVRQALALGINKQRIIEKLLFNKAAPGTSDLNSGFFACKDVQPFAYDPAKARQLLDAAGWVAGSDGIRVAQTARYAPAGTRLRLKFMTTTGNALRENQQLLIVEDMRAIGVELYIENAPSAVVIGSWDAAAPRRRGNFDIIMYSSSPGLDPHSRLVEHFASWTIPSEKNKSGTNYTRYNNPKVDELLKKAAQEADISKRKDLYCELASITTQAVNMIYLYQSANLDSYRARLNNWVENSYDSVGWNAADWWVE